MIRVKFVPECKLSELEVFELKDYKEFFEFYIERCDKGIIYGVEQINYEREIL